VNARTPSHNIFQPDSQGTARYGIVPWIRVEIVIGAFPAATAPDRSAGIVIPEIEGEGMVVERTDWPVLLAPVVAQGNTDVSLVAARDGLEFDSPFKGLLLAHPQLIAGAATAPLKLSLIVYKTKGALRNQLAVPISRTPLQVRTATNTGVAQSYAIFVPPGVRRLEFLRIGNFIFTTITQLASVTLLDSSGTAIAPTVLTQQIGSAVQTYNFVQNNLTHTLTQGAVGAALFDFPAIPIPSACREVVVSWVGTGLGAPGTIYGWWT
jgi:hypothetical protein